MLQSLVLLISGLTQEREKRGKNISIDNASNSWRSGRIAAPDDSVESRIDGRFYIRCHPALFERVPVRLLAVCLNIAFSANQMENSPLKWFRQRIHVEQTLVFQIFP